MPAAWLARARHDLEAARVLAIHAELPGVAGYLIHQGIKKGLKGLLLALGRPVPRVHDLELLLDEVAAARPFLEAHRDLCAEASDFYARHKYPGSEPERIDEAELERLLREAETLLDDLGAAFAAP